MFVCFILQQWHFITNRTFVYKELFTNINQTRAKFTIHKNASSPELNLFLNRWTVPMKQNTFLDGLSQTKSIFKQMNWTIETENLFSWFLAELNLVLNRWTVPLKQNTSLDGLSCINRSKVERQLTMVRVDKTTIFRTFEDLHWIRSDHHKETNTFKMPSINCSDGQSWSIKSTRHGCHLMWMQSADCFSSNTK